MRLEHVNLVVRDIERSLAFYKAACPHWNIRSEGQSEWSGKPRTWIHFGDDYNYIAICDNGESDGRDLAGHQVGLAHIAFETYNIKEVIFRLEQAGFSIAKPGAENLYRKNVYFLDPDGIEVEFVEYSSDLPSERNNEG